MEYTGFQYAKSVTDFRTLVIISFRSAAMFAYWWVVYVVARGHFNYKVDYKACASGSLYREAKEEQKVKEMKQQD